MNVTRFRDLHSGGETKCPPYDTIYIEADNEATARLRFRDIFHRDPDNVSCDCCGIDYSVVFYTSLARATRDDRCKTNYFGRKPKKYLSIEEYLTKSTNSVFIPKNTFFDYSEKEKVGPLFD